MRNLFDFAVTSTMQCGVGVVNAIRITLLREADDDAVAEARALLEGLRQPFGTALLGDQFYAGNVTGGCSSRDARTWSVYIGRKHQGGAAFRWAGRAAFPMMFRKG